MLTKGHPFVVQMFYRNLRKAGRCPLQITEPGDKQSKKGSSQHSGRRIKSEESQSNLIQGLPNPWPQPQGSWATKRGTYQWCHQRTLPAWHWTHPKRPHSDLKANHSSQAYFLSSPTILQEPHKKEGGIGIYIPKIQNKFLSFYKNTTMIVYT